MDTVHSLEPRANELSIVNSAMLCLSRLLMRLYKPKRKIIVSSVGHAVYIVQSQFSFVF